MSLILVISLSSVILIAWQRICFTLSGFLMLSVFCIENLTFIEVLPYCFLPGYISKVKAQQVKTE